jgi:DNA-binding NtrC family response regulator
MADTVLVTTHDLETAVALRNAFEDEGFRVELVTPAERIAHFTEPRLLVITGGLGEKRARRLVREAAGVDGGLPVLGLADSPDQATPEARRRLGLDESVAKPVDALEVALLGRRLMEWRHLRAVTGIVGEAEVIREVIFRVLQIAPVNATVLVTGESGTGKELVARGIHALSSRRDRRFVAANVAALPETLLESELFGHEKGSFTGAVSQRRGLFELADRGTLFLDEVGEMPAAAQTKLLRVLEDHELIRVGGEESIQVDVRVIAATNRDLRQVVELGQFRRDLYYRLNVLQVHMPPLRERRADIPLLVDAFLTQACQQHGKQPIGIAPEAMAVLTSYDWPGNVRELKNLIESLVVLTTGGVVRAEDLPEHVRAGSRRPALLPAPLPPRPEGPASPELEFVFRMLMQLRLDVEDIRREFEEYRRRHPEPQPALPYQLRALGRGIGVELPPAGEEVGQAVPGETAEEPPEGVVVFRPGKTMQDLEREAILAALSEVAGNRRKAAELLGIGERTLYRKIKEYGIQG